MKKSTIWVNTGKKNKMIHLKCSEPEKLKLEENAKDMGFQYVSEFLRWSVDTAVATDPQIATQDPAVATDLVATLKNAIMEFNKLMDYNRDLLKMPKDLDFDIISRGVELSEI